jgi:hypothetical protein
MAFKGRPPKIPDDRDLEFYLQEIKTLLDKGVTQQVVISGTTLTIENGIITSVS